MDSDGPIVIPVDQFFCDIQHVPRNELMMEKAKWLMESFECFQEGNDSKPKWHRVEKTFKKPMEKPRIIKKELSRESIAKRDFLGCMNKLAPGNRESVTRTILQTHRPEFIEMYTQIVWDFMLRAPEYQTLYIELLSSLNAKDAIHAIWKSYVQDTFWLPTETVLEESTDYDDFCEYVKWKKRAVAAVRAWMLLYKFRMIDVSIVHSLTQYIFDTTDELMFAEPSKKLEAILDQVLELVHYADHTPSIISDRIKEWERIGDDMLPIIKFKIYDIRDSILEKNDTSCKK